MARICAFSDNEAMRTDLLLAIVAGGTGLLITWGCSSDPDTSIPPNEPRIQALVLDYAHGPYTAGARIDVACIDTGRQGSHELGEGCDCLHLHSDSGISIVGTATTPDMAPSECGHGCLVVTSSSSLTLNCGGLDVDDPNHPRKGLCVQAPCG